MTAEPPRPTLCLVLGPPRSGTTLVSDWIMEARNSYCVHEVLPELDPVSSAAEIVTALRRYAATGEDRLGKPGQRAFIDWDTVDVEADPALLGWKEPIAGPELEATLAAPIETFLAQKDVRVVLLTRHPFDIVASGLRRAESTPNWPSYSMETLCRFWKQARLLRERLVSDGATLLCIRWEALALSPESAARSLTRFLGHEIVPTRGRERSAAYLRDMCNAVSPERGWITNPARDALDVEALLQMLGSDLLAEGYLA